MEKNIMIEIKRNLTKLTLASFIAFVLIGCVIFQFGIITFNQGADQRIEFIQTEKEAIECFISYMQYGAYGFRVMAQPSPLFSIFYNNTAFNEIVGVIDSTVRLRLEEPKQGKNAFSKPTGGNLDLSWYLLIFGSLLIMIWSFFTFRDIEYSRYIKNFMGIKRLFFGKIIARMILTVAGLLIVFVLILIQFLINGIFLNIKDVGHLIIFLALLFLVWISLTLISSAIGVIKNIYTGVTVAFLIWLIAIWIWPEALNMVFSKVAGRYIASMAKIELKKLKLMNEFETIALNNTQRYTKLEDKIASDKNIAKLNGEKLIRKIESIDNEMISSTNYLVKKFHLWSIFNPFTLLKSAGSDISNMGYKSYLELYQWMKEKRYEFFKFILKKRFYENYSKVVPFIPPDKAVINGSGHLPNYFVPGLIILLLYILGSFSFSFFMFKRQMFPDMKKITFHRKFVSDMDNLKGLAIDFRKGKHFHYDISQNGEIFLESIMNIFSGVKGFHDESEITLDGNEIKSETIGFIYIPAPIKLPGTIKIKHLFNLAKLEMPGNYKDKRLSDLHGFEKERLLFDLTENKITGSLY
jgi:ABC-type transport system involved in multi-copper enzyme maturation permease subunit